MGQIFFIERKYYFCCGCKQKIIEDDMVSYNCAAKKGICRACNFKYTLEQQSDLVAYGHIVDRAMEQISMF